MEEIQPPRPTEEGAYRTIGYDIKPYSVWLFLIGVIGCMIILKYEGVI